MQRLDVTYCGIKRTECNSAGSAVSRAFQLRNENDKHPSVGKEANATGRVDGANDSLKTEYTFPYRSPGATSSNETSDELTPSRY